MTLSQKSIFNLLEQVQKFYNKFLILNESDLQANLYHAFQNNTSPNFKTFQFYTERRFYAKKKDFIVDCVIEDKKENISALFEIKCDTFGYSKKAKSYTEGFELKTNISWSDLYWDYTKMHQLFSVLPDNWFSNLAKIGYIIGFTDSHTADKIFKKLIPQIDSYHESTPLQPGEEITVYIYSRVSKTHKSKRYSYS